MVIGNLDGQLAAAARMAADNGAPVHHADDAGIALALLQAGAGADLLIVDAAADIGSLAGQAHGVTPIVACGTGGDTAAAIAAVHAGAREYIPLPPDPAVIAAILAAVADDGREPGPVRQMGDRVVRASRPVRLAGRDGEDVARIAHAALAAETVTRSLVGRTVADVERDLILETLRRCLGNRTHAASILGISIRTLRNKLTLYAAGGIEVPPPNNGDLRGAA
jgi:DNA-binding NtrC family response regulator